MDLASPEEPIKKYAVGETGLQFDVVYRYQSGGSSVFTFTLENTKGKHGASVSDEDCFFQVHFELVSDLGFEPLAENQRITEDEDYRSNLLL